MTMPRGLVGAALIVIATLLVTDPVLGQGRNEGLDLTLSSTTIGFPTPRVADFDVGWIDHPGMVITLKSLPPNSGWEVRVQADAADLGGYGKPVGDLYWRTEGASTWTALTGSDQAIAQGQGNAEVAIYFRLLLDWGSDVPDTYSVNLIFSAVRP